MAEIGLDYRRMIAHLVEAAFGDLLTVIERNDARTDALDQVHVFYEYREGMSQADFQQALAFCSETLAASVKARLWEC